jgi:hypothetical protein
VNYEVLASLKGVPVPLQVVAASKDRRFLAPYERWLE